ncbi:unnamed protein product, partial [Polarella glacialis]
CVIPSLLHRNMSAVCDLHNASQCASLAVLATSGAPEVQAGSILPILLVALAVAALLLCHYLRSDAAAARAMVQELSMKLGRAQGEMMHASARAHGLAGQVQELRQTLAHREELLVALRFEPEASLRAAEASTEASTEGLALPSDEGFSQTQNTSPEPEIEEYLQSRPLIASENPSGPEASLEVSELDRTLPNTTGSSYSGSLNGVRLEWPYQGGSSQRASTDGSSLNDARLPPVRTSAFGPAPHAWGPEPEAEQSLTAPEAKEAEETELEEDKFSVHTASWPQDAA